MGLKSRSPREIFDMQQRPRVSGHTLLRLRLRRGNDVLDPRGLRVVCPEYPLSAKCSVATAAHSELASQITALLARSSWRSPCRSEKLGRSSSTAPTDPYRERALRSCAHGAAAVGSCARSSLLSGPEGPEPALGSCCTAVSVGSSTARHGVLCADIASMQQMGPRREYGLSCQCAIIHEPA
jgi:hypothetical protein